MTNPPQALTEQAGKPSQRVDTQRLWRRLEILARIGTTPNGGVNRPALSKSETLARRRLISWGQEFGAAAQTDAAANLFLRIAGTEPGLPPVMTGSYLDTQPGGGKFSGAYGMLAGLEALSAIVQHGQRPRRDIVLVAWTNGEGSRFTPGYMGSLAFAGKRPLSDMLPVTDADGIRMGDDLDTTLSAQGQLARLPLGFPCRAYVEAHLEQGPRLHTEDMAIGVVTGVQGVRRFQVTVVGEAAHVGTTPRHQRRDALLAALRIIGALNQFFAAPDIGFAVGQLSVMPNVPSVVPRQVQFSVDLRHRDNVLLTRLGNTVRLICESEKGPCSFAVRELISSPAVDFSPDIRALISRTAETLGLSSTSILSLGGHDAQNLCSNCPSGIIFIPCRDGISHNEAESIEEPHSAAGARVLTDVLWELAQS